MYAFGPTNLDPLLSSTNKVSTWLEGQELIKGNGQYLLSAKYATPSERHFVQTKALTESQSFDFLLWTPPPHFLAPVK